MVPPVHIHKKGAGVRHSHRSPLTGRFIATRTTGAELVEEHNKALKKRRLWELVGATIDALSLVAIGAALALLFLAERGVN